MILKRLGNKTKLAKTIQSFFPLHKYYVEPFFGAGGMFFNKTKAKYNIVNDLDSDVFNLYQVVINRGDELKEAFYKMPIHSDLLKYWRKTNETDPIMKAIRFLFLSNITYMGSGSSLAIGDKNPKKQLFETIKMTQELLTDVQFCNFDFKKFFKTLERPIKANGSENIFIYNDPPYLGTGDNYSDSFKEEDSFKLFEENKKTGCKWAMSEFNHPFILEQARSRNLNVEIIGERNNLKNKRIEILITNYEKKLTLFD